VEKSANQLAEYLRQLKNDWDILGATPATITKIYNRYRWQILLKFAPEVLPNLPSLEELRMLVNSQAVRVAIDVDPLTIL
jgi:primosomal protein N' (replication factor Y)